MKPFLYILILAMLVTSVSAVAYSDEYYTLGKEADGLISNVGNLRSWDQNFQKSIWLELRRHTILMEKQNELLGEQNGLLRNRTKMYCKPIWGGTSIGSTAIVDYDCGVAIKKNKS
jgi:hypothetical protein